MAIRFSILEKAVVFGAFMTVTGALVGGAYLMTSGEDDERPTVVSIAAPAPTKKAPVESVAEQTLDLLADDSPRSMPSFEPKQMADTLSLDSAAVATAALQPALHVTEIAIVRDNFAPPAPPPEPVAVAKVEPPKPATQPAPTTKLVAKPYVMKLPTSRVVHTKTADAMTCYELKLDKSHLELLRTELLQVGTMESAEVDEFDHIADAPAISSLPWWRPAELTDVNVLSIGNESSKKAWAAISLRTGRVFLYSHKPIQFTGR